MMMIGIKYLFGGYGHDSYALWLAGSRDAETTGVRYIGMVVIEVPPGYSQVPLSLAKEAESERGTSNGLSIRVGPT